jgi:hypothetical protein
MLVASLSLHLGVVPAPSVAEAIARTVAAEVAPVLGSHALDAALLLTYCKGETRCADVTPAGDGGQAQGPWQLHGPCNTEPIAKQAVCWLRIAAWSVKACAALPEPERLAALASGNCGHGHVISRTRWHEAVAALKNVLGRRDREMCTFSMVVDQIGPFIPDIDPTWRPPPTIPVFTPNSVSPYSIEQIEEWRRFFEDAKAKLEAAKAEDAAAGTPDCTDPSKAPILERLAEMERRLAAIEKAVGLKG